MFDLHGAGLIGPDQQSGVLIIGPSGSGKSTLATHLVASGWGYLSDDELLLTLENDLIIARGFRSFFALSAKTLEASGLAIGSVATEPRSKTCFEPLDVFGQGSIDTAVPRTLFFTSVGERVETQISELSRTEVMVRLLTACPWATYDREVAKDNLHVLSRLASQSKGFVLNAGRDLLTPNYADALLKTNILS
jgi:serine kinase of HPr protein (carbohydrate metabolism regulator)